MLQPRTIPIQPVITIIVRDSHCQLRGWQPPVDGSQGNLATPKNNRAEKKFDPGTHLLADQVGLAPGKQFSRNLMVYQISIANSTHGRIRTYNPWFRRPVLYPLSYARSNYSKRYGFQSTCSTTRGHIPSEPMT